MRRMARNIGMTFNDSLLFGFVKYKARVHREGRGGWSREFDYFVSTENFIELKRIACSLNSL